MAYRSTLPPSLEGVHPIFYVSQLRQYVLDPSHKLIFEELRVESDHTLVEQLMAILDRHVKRLRNKDIPLLLV